MRPNMDIPRWVHGAVREYGQTKGIDTDEAYLRIIIAGLKGEGAFPDMIEIKDERGPSD